MEADVEADAADPEVARHEEVAAVEDVVVETAADAVKPSTTSQRTESTVRPRRQNGRSKWTTCHHDAAGKI